ncbi:MAG TPA: TolC family protein [Salinimicrobium sp.]|nr:TolC family protein [Salinimicrobium sp.]
MKRLFVLTLLISVGTLTVNAQNKEWTLQECIQHALENNISIKQTMLDLESAEIDRVDAIGNFIPSLNASASNSWNTGLTQNITTGILQTQTTRNFSANVTAGMTLFDGLRNIRQLQRAKLTRLAAQYNLELMQDDIALMVANAYLQVLFSKENLKIIIAQNQLTGEQLARTQELVDAGVLPSGDLLEIKATDANEEQRIIVARNDIKIALINLAQMLLIDDYENFDIAEGNNFDIAGEEILNEPVVEVIAQAKEIRYEIKVAEENMKIAEKDVEIAKGAYWPTIGAFFNYNTRESGNGRIIGGGLDPNNPTQEIGYVESSGEIVVAPNAIPILGDPLPFMEQLYLNDGISYGLQLNIPIFNGFSSRNLVKRNEINVKRAEFQLEQAKLDLESDVYQAYVDAQGALKAYESALVALEAQEQANEYATERYDVGLTNAFEFSQSKLRLENAQSEALRAKYDYIFKLKVIELYFGIPIADLKF